MAYLVWTPELENQHPQMDQTHREFVELMGQVEAALGGEQAQLLQRSTSGIASRRAGAIAAPQSTHCP